MGRKKASRKTEAPMRRVLLENAAPIIEAIGVAATGLAALMTALGR